MIIHNNNNVNLNNILTQKKINNQFKNKIILNLWYINNPSGLSF